jgi:hypothetical protein
MHFLPQKQVTLSLQAQSGANPVTEGFTETSTEVFQGGFGASETNSTDWNRLTLTPVQCPRRDPVPGELLLTRRCTGPKHEKQGVTARPQGAAN